MVMETQGNESTGSESANTGGETTGTAESSNQTMPDDPKYAEGGGDELTAAKSADPKDPTAAAAKPAYTPNHKFKVLDKEQEFDDWVKDAIKDAETEKKARELFEKAHGLEHVKNDRQTLRQHNQQLAQENYQHQNVVQQVNQWRNTKDYGSLFGFLGIPEHDLFAHVKSILDKREVLANMAPEQRAAFEQADKNGQRVNELENQNREITQRYEQVAVNARTQELDWTLSRPEFAQAATAYDQRIGRPGAFKEAIIQRGQYHYYSTGQDLTAEQAVQQVLSFLGGPQTLMPPQQNPQVPPVEVQPNGPQVVAPQKLPTLTNIQGRGTSPAKKVVSSLAELRKRAQEVAEA